jgi:hypothetical protein
MNLVINFEDDDTKILTSEQFANTSLWDLGVKNETELSVFRMEDYIAFKQNPEELW